MRRILCALAVAAALWPGGYARAEEPCPRIAAPPISLPATRAALAHGDPLVIVAVGSSSTRGAAASNTARSYPAVLQTELERHLPTTHVAVINRGIDGQDAMEELARFDRDVVAVRPQLVIWQVGANAALRNADPAIFRATVSAGLHWLSQPGTDVIVMDNQRAPRVLESPRRQAIETALAEAARDSKVALFSRGQIMDRWREAGFPPQAFVAADGLHHNDRGYRCVAEALAQSILRAITHDGPAHGR